MTEQSAQNSVTFAAMIVGAIFLVRKFAEPTLPTSSNKKGAAAELAGLGPLPSTGRFVVGWGFAFVVIAALAQANPDIGGRLAQLVVLGDVLTNWAAVSHDLDAKLSMPSPGKDLTAAQAGFDPLTGLSVTDPLGPIGGTEGLTGADAADAFNTQLDKLTKLGRLGRVGKLTKADRLDPLAPLVIGSRLPGHGRVGRIKLDELQNEIELNAANRTDVPRAGSSALLDDPALLMQGD